MMDRTKFNTWKDKKDQFVESHDKLYRLEHSFETQNSRLEPDQIEEKIRKEKTQNPGLELDRPPSRVLKLCV